MNSLSIKVQIGLAGALFVVVSVLFSLAYMVEANRLEANFNEYKSNTLASLEVTLAQPVFYYDFEQIDAVLSVMLASEKIYEITIKDHRGKMLGDSKQSTPVDPKAVTSDKLAFTTNDKPTGELTVSFSSAPITEALNQLKLSYFFQALVILLLSQLFIFIILKRLVITPLVHVSAVMEEIASGDGDLSHKLPVESNDEIGQLATAFNGFVAKIHGTISKVNETSELILQDASSLGDLSKSNNHRVQSQLKETEAAVAAVTQLNSSANEVAKNASSTAEATGLADKEVDNSQQQFDLGLEVSNRLADELSRSVVAVQELQQETQRIDEVVVVINAIAEQTNLLALNAAIEAARAGEQGRGFAVVADEVRTLASRTQQATGEIQKMIQQVQTGVDETVSVMQASQTLSAEAVSHSEEIKLILSNVTSLVSNISNMNLEVAEAAGEQTYVTDDISKNLNDLATVSGSASLDSEQLAESSERLFHQGERLRALVGSFRLQG
ncbi:methyl-accepting chemotaxis protein [Shewanella woodyi]|uniref:Methyl-accepting chemotaxis sensory transducer n=1 Tax=Shewanella woodyi (strain ATCC 51908 / MS32) TaxID=392500 RepID=B1KIV4_SHEWM|nr:methyl-accepting chemotaxis protein [Shewanella woodyi]ACA85602.1 methyl-accepting chemotaxis sensory transducer [Shewanella woodyi ATCC 51908]